MTDPLDERLRRVAGEPNEISVDERGTIAQSWSISPRELAERLIADDVARGMVWRKCANCGDPYPITADWTDETVCDRDCHAAYVAYLNAEAHR